MTLTLSNLSGLTLDASAANLRLGTITLYSDGTTRFTIVHLQRGTEVLEHGRLVARARRGGTAAVTIRSGTTALRVVRPARAPRKRQRHRRSVTRRAATPRFTG